MKSKIQILLYTFLVFASVLKAQTYTDVLKTIEGNNKEILAGSKYTESKVYEYKEGNLPKGPELSYAYFPNNSSVPGAKEVFEVSQSFNMPCYYKNKSKYSKLMIGQEELNQQVLRQEILSKAKNLLVEYVYLMKQISVVDKRLKIAEDIYSAYLIRLETGDANALEVNKANLHLLSVKKQEKDLRTEVLAVKENLDNLNGGNDLAIQLDDYPVEKLVELDSLIFNKLANDPELLLNQKASEASEQRVKVSKNLQLPEFSLGYGSETVADEKFKGFIVGLTVPLWGSKNTIQQAKAESDFYNLNKASVYEKAISETKNQYNKVIANRENLESYEAVLSSINNEELLKKSLELGEISVIEYFTEMAYFYEVYDTYLLVEKDYYQSLAELLKYRL